MGYTGFVADPVSNVQTTSCANGELNLSWGLPLSYTAADNEVLVFAKLSSAITIGSPSNALTSYTANSAFGSGTAYENDASAFCVYKGDASNMTITGLNPGSTYHYAIFNTSGSPTAYSTEEVGS